MDAINHNKRESFNITVETIEPGRYQATTDELSSKNSLNIEFDLKPDNSQDILYMLDSLNVESIPEDELTKLGSRLFQQLFGDNIIGKEFRARRQAAYHRNIDLQIYLDIQSSELQALPREYLIEATPATQNFTSQGNHTSQEINVGSIKDSIGVAIGENSKSIVLSFKLPDLDNQILPPTPPRQMPTIEDFVGSEEGFIGRRTELAYYRENLNKLNFAIIAGMAGVGKTALTIQLAEQFMGEKFAEINASTDVIRRNTFWHDFLEDGTSLNELTKSLAIFFYAHGNEQLQKLVEANEKEINITSEFIYALNKQPFLLCLDNFPTLNQEDEPLSVFVKRLCDTASDDGPWIILNSRSLPPFVEFVNDHDSLNGFNLTDTGDFLRQLGVSEAEEYHKQIHKITEGNAQLLTLLSNAISPQEPLPQLLDQLVKHPNIKNFLSQKTYKNLTEEEQAIMKSVAIFMKYPDTSDVIEAMLTEYKLEIEIMPTIEQLRQRHLLFESRENNEIIYRLHSIVQEFCYNRTNNTEKKRMHYHAAKYYENQDQDTFRSAIHYQKAGKNKRAARVIVKNDVWTHIILGHATPLLETLQKIDKKKLKPKLCIKLEVAQGELYAYLHETEKAEECFDSALSKFSGKSSLFLPKIKAKIHLNKGEIFDHKDNDQALEWLQLGLKTLGDIKDKSKEVYDIEMALNVKMGSIYIAKGNYDAAAQFSQAGLSLSSNIANRRQAIAHLNLGDVYYHKGDIRRSIEETQRSIDICKQIDDQYWLVSGLINLGVLCFQMNEHMEALHIMEERLPPMLERLDSIKMRTYYGLNFGYMYFLKEDYINARRLLEECRQLSQIYDLLEMNISLLHSLVELEMKGGALHLAESYLEQALVLIKQTGTDRLLRENQDLQNQFNSIKENM